MVRDSLSIEAQPRRASLLPRGAAHQMATTALLLSWRLLHPPRLALGPVCKAWDRLRHALRRPRSVRRVRRDDDHEQAAE
eukprot:1296297-Prymnesium_polylepis.2